MNWLKKNATLLLWGVISLIWIWKDAPRGTPSLAGFASTLSAYLVSSAAIVFVVCIGYVLKAGYATLKERRSEDNEPLDPPDAFRKINLSCGDGHCHPDACCALSGLRAAGYRIEQSGGRGVAVVLKIIPPGIK